jgi:hypothetical protein
VPPQDPALPVTGLLEPAGDAARLVTTALTGATSAERRAALAG